MLMAFAPILFKMKPEASLRNAAANEYRLSIAAAVVAAIPNEV